KRRMSVLADVPRRTKIVALLGLTSCIVGGCALGFGPMARARAQAAAEHRGVQLEIGQVRLGWGAIWFRDVTCGVRRMPGVRARVAALRVGLGWHFNLAELSLHGAQIELTGGADELQQQWVAYRASLGQDSAAGSGGGARYLADGVDLVWRRHAAEPEQRIWGLRYERRDAQEDVSVDLARFHADGFDLDARRPRARLRRTTAQSGSIAPRRQLEALTADGLDVAIALTPAQRDQATVRPEKLRHFQPDPLRGVKLRGVLAELSGAAARSLPDGAALNLNGVSVRFTRGGDTVNFGPSALRIVRLAAQVDLSLSPKADAAGTSLELRLSLPLEGGDVHAQLRGGPVSLSSLGVREGDFGLSSVQSATLQASGDVTLAGDGSSVAFSGSGVLDQLSLRRPELSPAVLRGIRLAFRAQGSTSLDGAKLVLEDSEVSVGDVRVQGRGSLTRSEHAVSTHLSGGVPLASCQAFLDSTPRGLLPLLTGLRMSGTFAVQAQLDYDSEHPTETRVRLNVANDCHIDQIPPELSPRRFASYWRREVKGPDKQPMEVESGPGSADWVPYEAISPFMETAVVVCEDGHFPYHHGFDFEAIQNSIRDNLNKGRFARGASTVSMQLAKNLYLGKEKTLGRKLQEAVLTQLLEQELSKRELIELYLNVIEYGPGIYGIGPAARYYFAKRPSDLSLGQALYIASILPNPEHQHFDLDGKVSAGWTRYLQRLMHIAKKIDRITLDQLDTGLTEQVAFRVADSGGASPTSSPSSEEGSDTPTELSP
ncbi:MAG: transglycosylase domain-containing protein, partial [Polyangiaceae bacterium]